MRLGAVLPGDLLVARGRASEEGEAYRARVASVGALVVLDVRGAMWRRSDGGGISLPGMRADVLVRGGV